MIIRAVDKPESVQAPVEKGQKICKAEIVYADQVVATVQLVAANRVELSTFLKILNAVKAFFSLTVVRIVLGAAVLFVLVYLYLFIRNARLKKKRRAEKMRQYEEMQTSGNRDQDGRRTCRPQCIDKEKYGVAIRNTPGAVPHLCRVF